MSRMEDGDFHQQLHSLKDRVNALTIQYSPRQAYVAPVAPPRPPEDAFTAQLHDVKAHLSTLQQSIAKCEASMRQQTPQRTPAKTEEKLVAQSRMTLPSGPIFWQLFNSLRSDFQTLDTRVAGLEQDVDALEDRVDRLEPDQFTPAGSTASQDDHGGVQAAPKPSEDLLATTMAYIPELCSDEKDARHVNEAPQYHSRISSLQSQPSAAFEWQWPSGTYGTEQAFPEPYAPPTFRDCVAFDPAPIFPQASNSAPVYPEGVAFRDREIDRMDDQLRVVQESLRSTEALAASKDTTMSDMQAQMECLQAENQRVAAQLADKMLTLKKRENCIQQHKREREQRAEEVQRREEEQQKTLEGHLQSIADRDFAIRYWRERCDQEAAMYQHTIADRDRALQRWEESHTAVSDAWRQENERANALVSKLDQYRSDRRKEMEHAHVNYEREMDKLKEFCEHKDAVIVKQERVMSRGGSLLEERDAEIDRLQRRLRVAEDDMQHEGRQQKRMARLLDETQTELERLRSLSEVMDQGAEESKVVAHEQHNTMTASTEAVDGGESYELSLPRDQRRASIRQPEPQCHNADESEASAREAAHTGSPRQRRVRRHDSLRHLPHRHVDDRHRRHERRPSPPPRPQREAQRERFVADNADVPDRRRARFLDDSISFNPPLPAPVTATARKMASEADLRGPTHNRHAANVRGARAGAGRGLSKHQSMQELPGASRRRLQAYVETEGESEAERDGQGHV